MAIYGWFDVTGAAKGWFDYSGDASGWFDVNNLQTSGGGGGAVNYSLSCAVGTYSIVGNAATLTVARILSCATGTYNIAGQVATFRVVRAVNLAAGSYSVAGQSATFLHARSLIASAGSYSIAGQNILLGFTRKLACAAGTYGIVGRDATFTYHSGASGVGVYPDPAQVLYGIKYGPTGSEYTGTYKEMIKIELVTGRILKPLSQRMAILI